MKKTKLRGNSIYLDEDGEYRYSDNHKLTVETWKTRACGHCNKQNREDEHDACLGELPGVINACCGHGNVNEAYIQFENKSIKRGENALIEFRRLKQSEGDEDENK